MSILVTVLHAPEEEKEAGNRLMQLSLTVLRQGLTGTAFRLGIRVSLVQGPGLSH